MNPRVDPKSEDSRTIFTPSGVRLRLCSKSPGELNWLFLPGGPGIGSESLAGLVDAVQVPGACWLVDLPGDGSNPGPPDAYALWPKVLVEAAQILPSCVYAGHSTGGAYLLWTPEVEASLAGLALISTAPDASWYGRYLQMTQDNPIPAMDSAVAAFERSADSNTLRDLAVESAPWNFEPDFVEEGRRLLQAMPYNLPAVEWSDKNFDHIYRKQWWPDTLPTLIISGERDRIVAQDLWVGPQFEQPNVRRFVIEGAGHFPWVENPGAVRAAFADFSERISRFREPAA